MVTLMTLTSEATEAGLSFDTRSGPKVGFFARFRKGELSIYPVWALLRAEISRSL